MEISVSVPRHIWDHEKIAAFAKVIDEGPFASINFGERICFNGHDSMISLAILGGLTKRVKLMTGVLILPIHNPVLLAKQAASLYLLTGGRFSLGLGTGPRKPDFDAARANWHTRGKRFEEAIHVMRRVWAGQPPYDTVEDFGGKPEKSGNQLPYAWAPETTTTEPVPPFLPAGKPELYFGGFADVQLKRAGRLADGLHSFDFAPDPAIHLERYRIVQEAWDAAGRPGKPRLIASTFYALGNDADRIYEEGISDAYGYDEDMRKWALGIKGPTSPQAVLDTIKRFEDAGIDELSFASAHYLGPDALSLLADVIGKR